MSRLCPLQIVIAAEVEISVLNGGFVSGAVMRSDFRGIEKPESGGIAWPKGWPILVRTN